MWLLAVVMLLAQTLAAMHFHAAEKTPSNASGSPDFSNGLYVLQLQKFLHDYDTSSEQPRMHDAVCEFCMLSTTPAVASITPLIFFQHASRVVVPMPSSDSIPADAYVLVSQPRAPPLMFLIV